MGECAKCVHVNASPFTRSIKAVEAQTVNGWLTNYSNARLVEGISKIDLKYNFLLLLCFLSRGNLIINLDDKELKRWILFVVKSQRQLDLLWILGSLQLPTIIQHAKAFQDRVIGQVPVILSHNSH